MNAGYSGTPLAKKLGLTPGLRLWLVNPPESQLTMYAAAEVHSVQAPNQAEAAQIYLTQSGRFNKFVEPFTKRTAS